MAEESGRSTDTSDVSKPKEARNRRKPITALDLEWLGKSRDDAPSGDRPASENPFVNLKKRSDLG